MGPFNSSVLTRVSIFKQIKTPLLTQDRDPCVIQPRGDILHTSICLVWGYLRILV